MTTYDYIVKQREKEVEAVKPPVSTGRRKRVPVSMVSLMLLSVHIEASKILVT